MEARVEMEQGNGGKKSKEASKRKSNWVAGEEMRKGQERPEQESLQTRPVVTTRTRLIGDARGKRPSPLFTLRVHVTEYSVSYGDIPPNHQPLRATAVWLLWTPPPTLQYLPMR